jgi:RimJ/RimL family protein N-acetyltransferase
MKKQHWLCSVLLLALCVSASAEEGCSSEKLNLATEGSYQGPIDVSLQITGGIRVRIETENLILHSITRDNQEDYLQLFSDPETVKKYADGIPWTKEEIQERMEIWIKRWESQDPFSAFAVFLKNESKPFMGHIVLGHGLREGQAELAVLFKPEYLPQGYGQQAVAAILHGYAPRLIKDQYAPRLIKDQYFVNIDDENCQPVPLRVVHATVRIDDPYVAQALRLSDMQHGSMETLWGALRSHYSMTFD